VVRAIIAIIAMLIAAGAVYPAYATALPSHDWTGLTGVRASGKKKEAASFQEIQHATRGKKDLEIKVKVAKTDRSCDLRVEWGDGSISKDDDPKAGSDKICEFSVGVPSSRDAIGEATAIVSVRAPSGSKVSTISKTFDVER
jgi:hypothetical protein